MTNNEFNAEIDVLWARTKAGELPRSDRFVAIEELTDRYVMENGKRPEPGALDRLATLCLYEEVTDSRAWKMKQDDTPIMSDDQYNRRKYGTRRTTEDGKCYEVKINAAAMVGTDGRNYIGGGRRKLSTDEMLSMDKAKIRNDDRLRRYREFIKPSKVISYNINDKEAVSID